MAERRIVDIGPLLEDLKKELEDLEGSTEALTVEEATEDEIGELEALPVIDPASLRPTAKWIIARRMAEWNWEDLSDWGTYDEERDDYRIPEGWWEYRHFNPDDVYNNKIDCPVVGWMPLPPEEAKK